MKIYTLEYTTSHQIEVAAENDDEAIEKAHAKRISMDPNVTLVSRTRMIVVGRRETERGN